MFYQFIRKGEVILSEIHEETESSQTKYKKTSWKAGDTKKRPGLQKPYRQIRKTAHIQQ